jgi:hypothetical protein
MPRHNLFSRDFRRFFFFSSNIRNNGTITPIINSDSLHLIQISNLNSFQLCHFSSNHPIGFFFKYCFYSCIIHFSYKNKFLANPRMYKTLGIVPILPSMSLNLALPCPMILIFESSTRKTLPPSYLSYSQNHSLWGVL